MGFWISMNSTKREIYISIFLKVEKYMKNYLVHIITLHYILTEIFLNM